MGEGSVAFTQSAFGEASGLALTCETDFAAKSDTFVKFSRELLNEVRRRGAKRREYGASATI